MIAKDALEVISNQGIEFITGVPDSVFKTLLKELNDRDDLTDKFFHYWATNEGEAIGLATGYYLGSGKPGLVYMQNSGLGNCVDPLTSLTNIDVYRIPMILFIGWRGEPKLKDEPQHLKMGIIQDRLLKLLRIPQFNIPEGIKAMGDVANQLTFADQLKLAYEKAVSESRPVALIFSKGAIR